MLPARHRLRDRADFARAVRGRRAGSPTLVVHAAPIVDGGPTRVGFVVSKAVGHAVTRNRTKRRLRALMASRIVCVPDGCDVVVRATPAAAAASYDDLGADLDRALSRALASRPAAVRAPEGPA